MNIETRRALTAEDRCDRCMARACVLVMVRSGELLFCNHHMKEHELALLYHGAAVLVDEREGLTA